MATQIFLEFSSRSLGKWSNLTCAYFSDGLKPPTRLRYPLKNADWKTNISLKKDDPFSRVDIQQKKVRVWLSLVLRLDIRFSPSTKGGRWKRNHRPHRQVSQQQRDEAAAAQAMGGFVSITGGKIGWSNLNLLDVFVKIISCMYIYINIFTYIYIYIERERDTYQIFLIQERS